MAGFNSFMHCTTMHPLNINNLIIKTNVILYVVVVVNITALPFRLDIPYCSFHFLYKNRISCSALWYYSIPCQSLWLHLGFTVFFFCQLLFFKLSITSSPTSNYLVFKDVLLLPAACLTSEIYAAFDCFQLSVPTSSQRKCCALLLLW